MSRWCRDRQVRFGAALFALSVALFGLQSGTPAGAEATTAYVVKQDANARDGATTEASIRGKVFAGEEVELLCQERGEAVNGSDIWDLVQYKVDGSDDLYKILWMHDNSLDTGTSGPVSTVPQGNCPETQPDPGPRRTSAPPTPTPPSSSESTPHRPAPTTFMSAPLSRRVPTEGFCSNEPWRTLVGEGIPADPEQWHEGRPEWKALETQENIEQIVTLEVGVDRYMEYQGCEYGRPYRLLIPESYVHREVRQRWFCDSGRCAPTRTISRGPWEPGSS